MIIAEMPCKLKPKAATQGAIDQPQRRNLDGSVLVNGLWSEMTIGCSSD
jgi:hypothetical protein